MSSFACSEKQNTFDTNNEGVYVRFWVIKTDKEPLYTNILRVYIRFCVIKRFK